MRRLLVNLEPPKLVPGRLLTLSFLTHATATADIKNAQLLNIQYERGYTFGPVTLDRKRVVLSGRPDYGVWYGESEYTGSIWHFLKISHNSKVSWFISAK